MDMAPVPIYIKDTRATATSSPTGSRTKWRAWSRDQLVGLTDEAIMPPTARRIAASDRARILAEGRTYEAGGDAR